MAMDGLLARVRDRIRAKHYSLQTEKAYLQWIVALCGVPRLSSSPRIDRKRCGTILDDARDKEAGFGIHAKPGSCCDPVSLQGSARNQDRVGEQRWFAPRGRSHLPVVLTRAEVERVLSQFQGTARVIASLLYGAGLRVSEGLQLRVKDVDLEYRQIVVRDGKGRKDRITILPDSLHRNPGRSPKTCPRSLRRRPRNINVQAFRFLMHCAPSFRGRRFPGVGTSCSLRKAFAAIPTLTNPCAITRIPNTCSARCSERLSPPESRSRQPATLFGTALPRTFSRTATTSALCKNYWVTWM